MEISQKEFDIRLIQKLEEIKANELLGVPGFYEIVSEYLNNEILDEFESETEESEEQELSQ